MDLRMNAEDKQGFDTEGWCWVMQPTWEISTEIKLVPKALRQF